MSALLCSLMIRTMNRADIIRVVDGSQYGSHTDMVVKVSLQSTSSTGLSETSVGFDRKLHFSTSRNLLKTSMHSYQSNITIDHTDLWNIKPPDFSPKLYRTLSLPRIKKKTLDPAILQQGLAELSKRPSKILPVLLSKPERTRNGPEFITLYRPPGLLELQVQCVRSGKFPRSPYQNAKPHNFRPFAENLPDFVTATEKDPGKLILKSQSLEAGTQYESRPSQEELTKKLITFKSTEPKWEAGLILPKSPWPPKSASYTRHRRRRGVYSALLDRVEEKLSRSWISE